MNIAQIVIFAADLPNGITVQASQDLLVHIKKMKCMHPFRVLLVYRIRSGNLPAPVISLTEWIVLSLKCHYFITSFSRILLSITLMQMLQSGFLAAISLSHQCARSARDVVHLNCSIFHSFRGVFRNFTGKFSSWEV